MKMKYYGNFEIPTCRLHNFKYSLSIFMCYGLYNFLLFPSFCDVRFCKWFRRQIFPFAFGKLYFFKFVDFMLVWMESVHRSLVRGLHRNVDSKMKTVFIGWPVQIEVGKCSNATRTKINMWNSNHPFPKLVCIPLVLQLHRILSWVHKFICRSH